MRDPAARADPRADLRRVYRADPDEAREVRRVERERAAGRRRAPWLGEGVRFGLWALTVTAAGGGYASGALGVEHLPLVAALVGLGWLADES